MIRESELDLTRYPYTIELGSFRPDALMNREAPPVWFRVIAVCFRRRDDATVATFGILYTKMEPPPADVHEFLRRYTYDGRGGEPFGHWDGDRCWGPRTVAAHVEREHMAVLRPMLDAYPAVPDGFDG